VDAVRDTGERNVPMQMRRGRDCDRVDIALDQLVDICDRGTAQCAGNEFGLFPIRIGDANQFGSRQTDEYPGMIAAHYANAHDSNAQRTLRVCYCSLHHVSILPQSPNSSAVLP
jgi:hypothetical protein